MLWPQFPQTTPQPAGLGLQIISYEPLHPSTPSKRILWALSSTVISWLSLWPAVAEPPDSPHILWTFSRSLQVQWGFTHKCRHEASASFLLTCACSLGPDPSQPCSFPSGLLGMFPVKTLISVQGGCLVMLALSLPLAIGWSCSHWEDPGSGCAGVLNLLTPTGFRVEVGRIPLTSLVVCQRRILWHFLELVFIAVWLDLNPEATEKKSTDRTGLWVWNHTSPPMPQASMLGWASRGFLGSYNIFCKRVLGFMQKICIPGRSPQSPRHPDSSEDWFQTASRTLVWHQGKKSPLFWYVLFTKHSVNITINFFTLQRGSCQDC